MSSNISIAVIGAGSWGTAVANLCADQNPNTVIWGRDQDTVNSINERRENPKYLKGIRLSEQLRASADLAATLERADWVVCSIPTQQIRKVFGPFSKTLAGKLILNTCKGIELGTHYRVSEIFKEVAPDAIYSILSGPTFAQEVALRLPAAITAACEDKSLGSLIQQKLSNNYFRVYTTTDVVGVEFAGALKNVVAIATGVVTGLKLGYNAQAAIINRGLNEIRRIASLKGGKAMTFLGLAGMGDLILTCTGPLSRNRTLGTKLGEGKKLEQAVSELGGVAEGYYTAKSGLELAKQAQIEMPITEQVFKILYEGRTPQQALIELMSRDLRDEDTA